MGSVYHILFPESKAIADTMLIPSILCSMNLVVFRSNSNILLLLIAESPTHTTFLLLSYTG